MVQARKSFNFTLIAHLSPACFVSLALIAIPAVAAGSTEEVLAETQYMSNHEIRKLSKCTWGSGSCIDIHRDGDTRADLEIFFGPRCPGMFRRWKGLWVGSSTREWNRGQWQWEDPLNPSTEYIVYVPDPSDVYSALLLRMENESLARAYKITNDGQETEYLPSSERAGIMPRKLVYVSSREIKKVAGCSWGQTCNTIDLNSFFFHDFRAWSGGYSDNPSRDIFARWMSLYKATNPKIWNRRTVRDGLLSTIISLLEDYEYQENYDWKSSGRVFALSHPHPSNIEKNLWGTLLLETQGDGLVAVYRIGKDGTEVEYRPTYGTAELPIAQYRNIAYVRNDASSHFEDITDIRHYYRDPESLRSQHGVPWGVTYREVARSTLVRNFILQEPTEFFKEGEWYMPTWAASLRSAQATGTQNRGAWRYEGSRYYLFSDAPGSVVRILEFEDSDPARLKGVYDYHRKGAVRITLPEERRLRREKSPQTSVYDRSERAWRELEWKEGPHRFRSSVDAEDIRCGSNRLMILDDPADFFSTRGRAFTQWRSAIERLQKQHTYDYATDQSWRGANGNTYYLRRDACWEPRYKATGNPRWQILEFQDDELIRVYAYDAFWRETVLEEFPEPVLRSVLDEDPEISLMQALESGETSRDIRRKIVDIYTKPYPDEVQMFLQRLGKLDECRNRFVENEAAKTTNGDRALPNNLLASPAILSPACGVITLSLVLFFSARSRRKRSFHRTHAQRRSQEMGFDD